MLLVRVGYWGELGAIAIMVLKSEDLNSSIVLALRNRGHDVTVVPAQNETMGHAGMVKDDVTFGLAAAADPRSDGLAPQDKFL